MSVFINLGGDSLAVDGDRRQLVRSQAMKAYRRQQREMSGGQKPKKSAQNGLQRRSAVAQDEHAVPGLCTLRSPAPHIAASPVKRALKSREKAPRSVSVALRDHDEVFGTLQPRDSRLEASDVEAADQAVQESVQYLAHTMRRALRSPAAYRQQLIIPFLDVHFSPRAMPKLNLVHAKVCSWLSPAWGDGMITACDAVLLHALAVAQRDEALMWTARCKNNEAVTCLRKLLQRPDDSQNNEAIFTIDALAFFDTSSAAWPSHARGFFALVAAKGPSYWNERALLLHSVLFQLLIEALLSREPFVFGEAPWLSAMLPKIETRLNWLVYLGCQVPNILVRCDRCLRSRGPPNQNSASLWRSIMFLERSLLDWLSDWYQADFQNRPPYGLNTDVGSLELREGIVVDSPPLHGSYRFPSLIEAIGHHCFWTLLLLVCEARYDLLSSSSDLVVHECAATLVESVAKESASQCADAICRTAPFLMQSVASLPNGLASCAGPLIVAARWYGKCGQPELASWCHKTVEVLTDNYTQSPGWITRSCAAWVTAAL